MKLGEIFIRKTSRVKGAKQTWGRHNVAVTGMICLRTIIHFEFSANSDLFLTRKLKTQKKAIIVFKSVRVLHYLPQKIILDILGKDATNEQTTKTSEGKLIDTDDITRGRGLEGSKGCRGSDIR